MGVCNNCGKQIDDNSNYCPNCGQLNKMSNKGSNSINKIVYDGHLHRCPRCEAVIEAFVTKCPYCGNELRDNPVSSSMQEFVTKLNNTTNVTAKADIIRSFPVPNNKEDIFEFMILASSNIDEQTSKLVYDAWVAKIDQCYNKARLLFGQDEDLRKFQQIYDETIKEKQRVKRRRSLDKNSTLIFLAITMLISIIGTVVLVMLISYVGEKTNKNSVTSESEKVSEDTEKSVVSTNPTVSTEATTGISEETFDDISVKNFTLSIPDYWSEEGSKKEYLQYYAKMGKETVMLAVGYPKETDDDYEVSFDGLYSDNDNMIKSIENTFKDGDVVDYEIFESKHKVKGILYRFTYSMTKDTKGCGYMFCFPSEEDRRWFYITITYTNNLSSKEYVDDYMKTLSSIQHK